MKKFPDYPDYPTGPASDTPTGPGNARLPYAGPVLQRVELAIDETLATGCKLGDDSGCVGPPVTAFEGGS